MTMNDDSGQSQWQRDIDTVMRRQRIDRALRAPYGPAEAKAELAHQAHWLESLADLIPSGLYPERVVEHVRAQLAEYDAVRKEEEQ